ncbi:ABC transporter permease [Streptomyces sp. NPDC057565]|uniref:ABC transporter permease n=1 Tax=Streptomyces sp. NPDC057565 TaxID=3346169 RepID=UPI0036A243FA
MSVTTLNRLNRRALLGRLRATGFGPVFWTTVAVLGLLVLVGLLAPLLAPHDPDYADLTASMSPPSADHLLGTDYSGRDVLSRLIHGTRPSLFAPFVVVVMSTVLGVLLGLVSAWKGGLVDAGIARLLDLAFAFPALLVSILVVAMVGPGLTAPVIAMGIAYTPYIARLVRATASTEQGKPYISAYRVQGFSGWTISLRHVLPNISGVVFAQSTLNFGYALIDLATLSYLGFGVQPPGADWGNEINQAQQAILLGAPLSALVPGLAVVLAVVAFNIVGEGIADQVTRRER